MTDLEFKHFKRLVNKFNKRHDHSKETNPEIRHDEWCISPVANTGYYYSYRLVWVDTHYGMVKEIKEWDLYENSPKELFFDIIPKAEMIVDQYSDYADYSSREFYDLLKRNYPGIR